MKQARLQISCARHTTSTLARVLSVSVATLMRALHELRVDLAGRKAELVSVRERSGWHYEIRSSPEIVREQWRRSALRRLAGARRGAGGGRLKPEDAEIYGNA